MTKGGCHKPPLGGGGEDVAAVSGSSGIMHVLIESFHVASFCIVDGGE